MTQSNSYAIFPVADPLTLPVRSTAFSGATPDEGLEADKVQLTVKGSTLILCVSEHKFPFDKVARPVIDTFPPDLAVTFALYGTVASGFVVVDADGHGETDESQTDA